MILGTLDLEPVHRGVRRRCRKKQKSSPTGVRRASLPLGTPVELELILEVSA
jgi:hypothetical protein